MFCSASYSYSIYSIGGCYTCYIVYYILHYSYSPTLCPSPSMQILVFEHIVFSIWARARPERGLAASSSTSQYPVIGSTQSCSNIIKVELCYAVL